MATIRLVSVALETGGEREFACSGETVREVLADLDCRVPGALEEFVQGEKPAPSYNMIRESGAEGQKKIEELSEPIAEDEVILIFPIVTGGCSQGMWI